MGRKTLDSAEAKKLGSKGGKTKWAGVSAEERSQRMKAVRKGKSP